MRISSSRRAAPSRCCVCGRHCGSSAYYLGDEVSIGFNMDSGVDAATLKVVNSFDWPHRPKTL